jgi:hypothetical protein
MTFDATLWWNGVVSRLVAGSNSVGADGVTGVCMIAA